MGLLSGENQMQSLTLHSHVGSDGILLLKVPFTPSDANLEVKVTIQPLKPETKTPEELGYPSGFFEEVAGGWAGEPLVREQPIAFDKREAVKWDSC
jgi:hypothetical protein